MLVTLELQRTKECDRLVYWDFENADDIIIEFQEDGDVVANGGPFSNFRVDNLAAALSEMLDYLKDREGK